MEEIAHSFLLKAKLHANFNQSQWQLIQITPHSVFLQEQRRILQHLINNEKLYNQYFQKFYNNHLKILNWYILATRNQSEIKPYVFQELVKKKITFFNQKLRSICSNTSKQNSRRSSIKDQNSHLHIKALQHYFNENITKRIKKDNFQKIKQEAEKIPDGHEMYLKTFEACNGWHYVYYDYEKHLKGKKQRQNQLSDRSHTSRRIKQFNHKLKYMNQSSELSKYEEFTKISSEKASILTFSQILKNSDMNTERGLKSLLKRSSTKKLVLINHQRKPVNYFIK